MRLRRRHSFLSIPFEFSLDQSARLSPVIPGRARTGMRVSRKHVELTVAQVRGLHRRHTYRADYVYGAIRVALESAIACRATQLLHRNIERLVFAVKSQRCRFQFRSRYDRVHRYMASRTKVGYR